MLYFFLKKNHTHELDSHCRCNNFKMRQSSDTPVLSTFFSEQVIEGVMPFHIVEFCSAEAKQNLSQDLKVDGCKIKPYDGR